MFALLLAVTAALACPDITTQVRAAQALVDDAEVEAARATLDATRDALSCQSGVVSSETLLALHHLDALVAFSEHGTPEAATPPIMRAVATRHIGGAPPANYGKELGDLYHQWAGVLSRNLITISVDGGGTVWVDGRPATASGAVQVPAGEHLVQTQTTLGITNQVFNLSADSSIPTGVPAAPMPAPAPAPVPMPAPQPVDLDTPPPTPTTLKHPFWLWGGGAALTGLGVTGMASGARTFAVFNPDDYKNLKGCNKPCADKLKRRDTIVMVGSGVGGLGASIVGIAMFRSGVIGVPVSHSPGLELRLPW